MALENFRQVKLQMNKADGSILKTIYAKEDDHNGRELVIQITDDGIVRDLTGADVNLGWKNLKVGNQGLEPFTAIDSTQGTYKVVYPTEMLNKGEILCTIQLIYDGSMIHSRNFKIIIESNPVDSDAVESDNNFSVLQDALIRISTLEEGYAPRLNAVEGSVDSLADYIGNLATLTTVEKSNIVGALNEIDTNHKLHLAEYASDKEILFLKGGGRKVLTGINSITSSREVEVIFNEAFSGTPSIITTLRSGGSEYKMHYITLESATGFTFRVDSSFADYTAKRFSWIAIGY